MSQRSYTLVNRVRHCEVGYGDALLGAAQNGALGRVNGVLRISNQIYW